MFAEMNGKEIIDELSNGGDWWRLRSATVGKWLDTLPRALKKGFADEIDAIGRHWDGRALIQTLQEDPQFTTINPAILNQVISELELQIQASKLKNYSKNLVFDVRIIENCATRYPFVVLDLDLVDFILPVSIYSNRLKESSWQGPKEIAAELLAIAVRIDKRRDTIVREERRYRESLLETVDRFGHQAAPLWVRLSPITQGTSGNDLKCLTYDVQLIFLNEWFIWCPAGSRAVFSDSDIKEWYDLFGDLHVGSAQTLAKLQQRGTAGFISHMALALMIERGLCPNETFHKARDAALSGTSETLKFQRGECAEEFVYHGWSVSVEIAFDSGVYRRDTLKLLQSLPETVLVQAKGRPLSDLVDHPAFVLSKAIVSEIAEEPSEIRFIHEAKFYTIEEACRISQGHAELVF